MLFNLKDQFSIFKILGIEIEVHRCWSSVPLTGRTHWIRRWDGPAVSIAKYRWAFPIWRPARKSWKSCARRSASRPTSIGNIWRWTRPATSALTCWPWPLKRAWSQSTGEWIKWIVYHIHPHWHSVTLQSIWTDGIDLFDDGQWRANTGGHYWREIVVVALPAAAIRRWTAARHQHHCGWFR